MLPAVRTLASPCTLSVPPHPHSLPCSSRFLTGASPILLVTERFYFFRRTRIKGAKRVIFYAPPTAPHFYPELVNMLVGGLGGEGSSAAAAAAAAAVVAAASVTLLFTRCDAIALERIVGTRRVARLVDESSARSSFAF